MDGSDVSIAERDVIDVDVDACAASELPGDAIAGSRPHPWRHPRAAFAAA